MDFGKLDNIDNTNFSLPPDALLTPKTLAELPKRAGLPKVYIGCTGWGMKEWVGRTYPKGAKATDFLRHYAQQFNTIELNTTHYRTPSETTAEEWYAQTPADFRFAPKLLQAVSHSKSLGYGTGQAQEFFNNIALLREKMGVCFIQLPPYFRADALGILEAFLKKYAHFLPLAIEVRHEEWFNTAQHWTKMCAMLRQYGVSTVITDVSGRRDVLHQTLTTEKAVIRFVGNALHQSDYTRIDEWVERLQIWFEAGLHEVYFFTHEPDNLLAPELAKYLHERIKITFEADVRGPKFYDELPPAQISLF